MASHLDTALPLTRRTLSAALLLALVGPGCASDPASPDEPDPGDTTAPMVNATQPASNAIGVAADGTIVITFSEPMDPASVEAAYSSTDLPAAEVSFSWNATDTVLTITPAMPLEYASGIGVDLSTVPAKTYAVAIGAGATDLAGNPLAAPLDLTFATKRRMLAGFPTIADMTRVLRNTTLLSVANPIWIGDNSQTETYRSYLTFDLSTLPPTAVVEGAQFSGRQTAPSGAPYGMGAVMVQHITYPAMIDAGNASPLSTPGPFSTDPTLESKTIIVTDEVKDDVVNRAARNHRSQFRLRFDTATNGNAITDTAVFAKDSFAMTVLYVAD